jgi:hypothetical protein
MKQIDYQLEKAHIDLTDLHTQMTIGAIVIFCLCVANYLPMAHCTALANKATLSNQYLIWQIIDFVVYFLSCMLTAFICLEISGRFGNRLGAAPALWSALLLAVFPLQIIFFFSLFLHASRIISLFILFIFWLLLRKSSKDVGSYTFLGISIIFARLAGFLWPRYTFFDGIFVALVITVVVVGISFFCLIAMSNYRIKITGLACWGGLIILVLTALAFEMLFTSFQGCLESSVRGNTIGL